MAVRKWFLDRPGHWWTAVMVVVFGGMACWMSWKVLAETGSFIRGGICLVLGVALMAFGGLLLTGRGWPRWACVILLCALAAGLALNIHGSQAARWRAGVAALSVLAGAYFVYRDFRAASQEAESKAAGETKKPLVSLVLLLRKPRHLEAVMLARYCEAAWGGGFHVLRDDEHPASADGNPETDGWVGGRSPCLFVGSPRGVFLVHNHDSPYFTDQTKLADTVGDLRFRKVLEENRGWMAVDFMESHDSQLDGGTFYPLLARLLAELAGPDCLAVLQPAEGRFNHWDESLEAKLRSGVVADVFAEPTRVPVVEVAEDDPRMSAAVAEAIQRWPEFVTSLASGRGNSHAVKAAISHGDRTEFIWVDVDRVEDNKVHGSLGNEPVDLGDLKFGSKVSVAAGEIQDWAYVEDGEMRGLFSVKVLNEIQQERRTDQSSAS